MDATKLTTPVNIRVDRVTKERLRRIARRHGLKVSDLVREAVSTNLVNWERGGMTFKP